jgi:hypothetical protein
MTEQPKSQDMVEAWSALSATKEHRHHGLETSLRNKSGKVAIYKNVQVTNPALFLFSYKHTL